MAKNGNFHDCGKYGIIRLAAGKQPPGRSERPMLRATTIQERLWELRKDKGLNLEELSELTGISKSALGSYEKEDYKEINHGNLITLADFYGVSVDYLLCRTENREQINTPLTELHLNDEMVALLKSDEIDQIDADEFTELLKMECVEAMTQDVKENAKENPLDMTSFIVNPNIYQNAVDDNNTPINTVANGWECQTTADSQERTKATSGDTWLYCWSWSGKESNNIASSTDYHQVLGNYGAQESKVALPDGAYRLEAATWCTKTPELLQLYALTRNVSTEIVPDINQNDSTVYVFSDSVYAEAVFNADTDAWDIAQNTLSTTTVIPEIYVENGSLVIGIKGSGVITGNGQYWFADNFRLYYVGPNKGDNISAPSVDNNDLMKEVARGVDTYWMNEPLRFATTHKHTLSIEGGDATFRYGAGLSYGKTEGVMKGSDREVMNGNIRLIYRKGKLSFTNNLNINYSKADREPVAFSEFAKANPYFRKYDENGELKKILFQNYAATYYNPLYDMNQTNFEETKTTGFTNNFEVDWRVIDELRVRGRFGLTKSNEQMKKFRSPFNTEFNSQADIANKGSYEERNTQNLNYDGDFSLTYGKLFNEKHMVNVVGGMRLSQNGSNNSAYKVQGFIDDEFSNPAFALGYQKDGNATYQDSKKRAVSYYLNFGYAYDDRYLLDVNYRSDGSSVFGSDRQFTNTWSVGLGWNIHKEAFFSDIEGISLLKLRASIGNPGNQNFDDYISTRIYTYNTDNMNIFGSSAIVSNLGNRNLEWQKTLDRNIGFDIIFLDNRLRVNFDYFNKRTDPLLVQIGTASSTGVKTLPRNVGKQITEGITLTMNYSIIRREDMFWSVNMNLRHQTSEYKEVSEVLTKYNLDNRNRNLTRYYDGGSPSDLWAVRSCGIDPATGREIFLDKNGEQTFVHNYDDEVVVGNSDPKVEGVIGTSFYYKGFSASINLRYRLGGQIFMQTLYDKVENLSSSKKWENLDKRALYDRWKQPGDQAKFKSIASSEVTPISSRFVEDNNVLSGESISLGYESTAPWLKHIGASSMSVRAYMNDIFRISTVKNERGLSYPFARSVSFSLGVTF
mgnify:CR=1 FL=1